MLESQNRGEGISSELVIVDRELPESTLCKLGQSEAKNYPFFPFNNLPALANLKLAPACMLPNQAPLLNGVND